MPVKRDGGTEAYDYSRIMPGDVRDYLLAHPDFLSEHDDILSSLVPPMHDRGDKVEDFQRFMLARLQENFVSIKDEHDDLLQLMQDHMQRQNRFNAALLAAMDATSFSDLLRVVAEEWAVLLDHQAVRFFVAAPEGVSEGDYGYLRVVPEAFLAEWLAGRDLVLEEQTSPAPGLFGDAEGEIRSRALVRVRFGEGIPHGLLAFGHEDPFYYSTGLATEQLETLAAVFERRFRAWLT